MANGEYQQFIRWLKASGAPVNVMRAITPTNYKNHPYFAIWKPGAAPVALSPTQEFSATTSIEGMEITPEEYVGWRVKLWREATDDAGNRLFDESRVTEMRKELQSRIDMEGFTKWLEGYGQAADYWARFEEQGLSIIQNYEGKGYDVAVDEQGNMQIIGETSLDESEMNAWQKAQYKLDLKQFGLSERKFAFERQQTMGLTPWQERQVGLQERQAGLDELRYAVEMAGRGNEYWIDKWYADEARRAQFEQKPPSPWYMGGHGLAGIAGWGEMRPEERGEWLRRKEKSQWAGMHPEVQEMVTAGYGFPKATPGAQFGYGETWPGFAEAPQPEWEAAKGTTSQFLPTKTISIKPSGEISIKEDGGMPERGRAGQEPTSANYRDVYLKRPAPTAPVGKAPPRKKGKGRARPRPTAPPMPAELGPFLPQAVVGEPIQKGWQIPPPSGQLWGRTPPSTRGKLAGYTRFGGGRSYEDLMWQMGAMQPRTPAGVYGRRWQPARQY